MSKLLRANFVRLFKNRLFHFCTIFIFAAAVLAVFNQVKYNEVIDGMLFSGIAIVSVVSAVFISIFTGAEYSGGTMRNKLCTGHSRIAVYGANLAVCTTSALIMHIILIAAVVCFGIPVIGKITLSFSEITAMFLISVLVVTAYASVYILFGMLITSKAAGAVSAVILSFLLIISADTLERIVNAPEYRPDFFIDEKSETGSSAEFVPNSNYPTGTKRKVMEIALNIMPSGQALQISGGEPPENAAELPLYAIADIAVTTTAGILIFRRKDLK